MRRGALSTVLSDAWYDCANRLPQSLERNQAQIETSLQNLEDIRANHRTKCKEAQQEIREKQQMHERMCGELKELQVRVGVGA